jgi:hypothetical protein
MVSTISTLQSGAKYRAVRELGSHNEQLAAGFKLGDNYVLLVSTDIANWC